MKKLFIILFVSIIFFLFFQNESYDLKIEIKSENISPQELDINYAKNIERAIRQLREIKNVIIFSSIYGMNIYCKYKPFANKDEAINKIQRYLNLYSFDYINIDDRYYLKYDCFVIVKSKNNDYYSLEKNADDVLDELLKLKFSKKIKILGYQQKAVSIYITPNSQLRYDLDIDDIKKIIKTNNIRKNTAQKNEKNSRFSIKIDSFYQDLEELNNTILDYKNTNYPIKLKDIFKIKEEIKFPNKGRIFFEDKNAIVLAISKYKPYPNWLIKYKLKDYNIEIINPNHYKRDEIYLNSSSNINESIDFYKKIQNNSKRKNLYFIGFEAPKTNKTEHFEEIKENRIIIFNKDKNIKEKNEKIIFAPTKITGINYEMNNLKLNDYQLSNEDISNFILLNTNGVYCDYFWNREDKTEILLKNEDTNNNYIYSKKLKSLIPKDAILKANFEAQYNLIARYNFKNATVIKSKNPSLIRRVILQIR